MGISRIHSDEEGGEGIVSDTHIQIYVVVSVLLVPRKVAADSYIEQQVVGDEITRFDLQSQVESFVTRLAGVGAAQVESADLGVDNPGIFRIWADAVPDNAVITDRIRRTFLP